MKKIIAFFLVFFLLGTSFISAQENANGTLSIANISVISNKEIDVTFSQPIVISTLRIMLENQLTRDVISVKWYQETNDANTARVEFASEMSVSTSYKMTVSTATATTGETIVAWVNAIREFTTPEKFESTIDNQTLSAPANTSATTATQKPSVETKVETKTETKVEAPKNSETKEKESEKTEKISEKNSTLPETGMGMYLVFCILTILFSAIAMTKAKRV